MTLHDLNVIKKNGLIESFNIDKILTAISKAAEHTLYGLTSDELTAILEYIYEYLEDFDEEFYQEISVDEIHDIVIAALFKVREDVAQRYVAYHEFKKSQEISINDLFGNSANVENLNAKELKQLQESIISTNLAKTYSLRPDWLEAINDKIINIPLIETLWLKTYETKVFDFNDILKNQEKYFGQVFPIETVEDMFMLLILLINKYGPLYTRRIIILNFMSSFIKFYDKSSENDLLKLIEKQFLFVDQLVKSLNLDVKISLSLDLYYELLEEQFNNYINFINKFKYSVNSYENNYNHLFDLNNYHDNKALTIKLNVQALFNNANKQLDIFINKLNKYLNMIIDIFKVHEKKAKIEDGGFTIIFENIHDEIDLAKFWDLLCDLNIDLDMNNEQNYISFKFKK